MGYLKQQINLLLSGLIFLLLVGCGGGSESSGATKPIASSSLLKGTVIDGEISGATVFLDLNRNGRLDRDEPTATSDGNGTFKLLLTAKHKQHKNYINRKAPIVIYGGVDIRTGEAFEDYLTAIVEDENATNVTPLTTLIAETLGDALDNDVNNTLNNIDAKMREIKANLANLLNINQDLLTKNPIELAKEGNMDLLDTSLQMHKVAREMKKAMRSEVKDLRRSILKSYRAMAKSFKTLQKSAIKSGDTALVAALDNAFNDTAVFDSNLIANVNNESKELSRNIRNYWQQNNIALSDSDITNAVNGIEVIIVNADSSIVNDTQAPVIIRFGRSKVKIIQGTTYVDRGAIAQDNKDGNLTGSIIIDNPVNSNVVGTYTITYNVKDAAGNSAKEVVREVTVVASANEDVDKTKPRITLNGESNITILQGSTYFDAGATATDNRDGNITANIKVSNPVDVNSLGVYTITYNVQDSAGNSAETVSRMVTVTATILSVTPSITTLPRTTLKESTPIIINGISGTSVFVNGVKVGIISSNGTANVDLNTSGADGNKSFTITLRDSAGNSSEALTITIERISITRAKALKFLRQASFRNNESEITYVMENGYEAWIDNQFSLVGDLDNDRDNKYGYLESSLRLLNKIDPTQYPTSTFSDPTLLNETLIDKKRISAFRGSIFWDKALDDENQLRQRVAYALSQILVVADASPAGQATRFRGEAISQYYDILYKHSFGNYRELLTDVTHSAAMGYFMTYIGSKAEAPDENYARELTQLFTIGLYELNDDGTPQGGGRPTPSYNQSHVTNLSKVFTGWGLDDKQLNAKGLNARYGSTGKTDNSWSSPLKFTAEYHDTSNKTILNNQVVSGNTDGSVEIEQALDYLFANHNVAPFISRQLIMRLVTSNPTSAYVGRVSAIFNNNGSGVKGDLKAVVKAILLDPEARGVNEVANFGKVDEMLLGLTHFLSAFNAHPIPRMHFSSGAIVNNVYWLSPDKTFEQALLSADSVFNFYSNEFVPSATYFATNNLVAPELQIQNTPNLIRYSNLIKNLMQDKEKYDITHPLMKNYSSVEAWATTRNYGQFTLTDGLLYLDLTPEYEVFEKALDNEAVANKDFANMGEGTGADANRTRAINALLEHLDNKLLGGTMPQAYKTAILEHLEALNYTKRDRNRVVRARAIVTTAIQAIVTSSLFMVLK